MSTLLTWHGITAQESLRPPILRPCDREVERIGEETRRWPNLESSEGYGCWDNRGAAVVHEVTGPGSQRYSRTGALRPGQQVHSANPRGAASVCGMGESMPFIAEDQQRE